MIVRELFAKLGLDVDAQSFAKGEIAASIVKGALTKVVETAGELAHKFVEMVQETANYGKETKEAAQATGLTTDALQRLRGAARATGVESSDLDMGLFKLSRSMYAAKKGGEEQAKTFSHLKVKVTDAHGKLRGADDVLGDLAEKFSKMPDGAEKTALAMEVFGRSGARLIPMLNKGKDGLDELKASAVVMSAEQIEAGEEMVKTQRQLANMTTKLWRGAVAPLLPAINNLLKRYLEWRKSNAEIMRQKIQHYLGAAIKAVNMLADTFSFLVRNATAVKALVITGLIYGFLQLEAASTVAAVRMAAAWVAAALPFIGLAALIAGILLVFDDIRVYQQGGKSLYGRFKKEIEDWMKPRANDPWWLAAIKDLVKYLHDAIELLKELKGDTKPAVASGVRANENSPAWAKGRRVMGAGPLTAAEQAEEDRYKPHELKWWEQFGLFGSLAPQADARYRDARTSGSGWWDAAKAGLGVGGPVVAPPSRGGGGPTIVAPVTQQIYAAPGMTPEQVADIAKDKIVEHWNAEMEAAAAAAGP